MDVIIKKQRLQVECLHQKNAWRYTDQVKQIFEKAMMPLLEKKLQQYDFDGQTLYLDRVNIQLGTVDPSNLSTLVQRFEEQVDKELMAQLATFGNQKETTQSKKNLQKSTEDTIIYYLEHGYLPWWSKSEKEKVSIDTFLLEWLHQNSKYRSQLLRNWKKWSPRIVSTCKEATLIRLSSELFHEESLLVPYIKHLYTLIPSRRTSSQTRRILQVQLWGKALVALHKKTPVQHIAVSLLEIAYTVLTPKTLSTFKKQFFNDTISKPKGWDTLLSMVWKDFERSVQKTSDFKFVQKGKTTQQTSLDKIAQNQPDTLKTNASQAPSSPVDDASKERLHLNIDDSQPTEDNTAKVTSNSLTLKSVETQQTSQKSFEKIAQNHPDTLKTDAGQLPSSLEDDASKEQLYHKDHPNNSKESIIVKETEKFTQERHRTSSSDTKASQLQPSDTKKTAQFWQKKWEEHMIALRKKVKNPLSEPINQEGIPNTEHLNQEAQEIYIHNAGMVICAPYIPQLFQVLGLTKSNEFTSDLSMTKALMLGHYLATGEVEVEEHQLPLVKLLCGVPISTTFITGITLSEKEQMRANELLKAVINNWSRMGNVSPQGFQNAFLQREGKLSMQRQQWRLQVEQRPHDLILQTLPWNIRMIKTSLMQEIINVEWPY